MEAREARRELDALLAEGELMRRLARRLLADEHRAEDLAQDAIAAALARPPERGLSAGALRAYLGGIVRNLAGKERRGAARRAARERAAARAELTTPTDVLVAREEWRRRVVEAVLALPAHERDAVLLRWFEELPPRSIARRLGVPVSTVKTRLERGLARLRPRLAAGRERRELLEGLALLALPAPQAGSPLPTLLAGAGAIMGNATKITLAAAALLTALAAVQLMRQGSERDALLPAAVKGAAGPRAETPPAPEGSPLDLAASDESRVALAQPPLPEPSATSAGPTHRITGRVLDAARRPVPDAAVEIEGAVSGATRSSSDGRFALSVSVGGGGALAHVLAHDSGSGAARARAWLRPAAAGQPLPVEVELEALVLLPAHRLVVEVLVSGRPASAARVGVELTHARERAFERATDAQGLLELEHLPRGPVYLTATTGLLAGRALAFVPEEPLVRVELEETGAVELHLVDADSGEGIAGARVRVEERRQLRAPLGHDPTRSGLAGEHGAQVLAFEHTTDGEGRARLDGLLPGASYELRFLAEGYADRPRDTLGWTRVEADTPPVRVALPLLGDREVRWPLVAGEVGIPADGTPVELSWAPSTRRIGGDTLPPRFGPARVEGGELVARVHPGPVALRAATADGALAQLAVDAQSARGAPVAFHAPRVLEVLVRDAAGEPVVGAVVAARSRHELLVPQRATGADGRARLAGLHAEAVDVQVSERGVGGLGRPAGQVDLAAGDAELVVTLPAGSPATLRLTVGGEARLPSRYALRSAAPVRVVDEDPARGELFIEVQGAAPGDTVRVRVEAPGHRSALAELAFPEGGGSALASVELEPATARLVAHVVGAGAGRVSIVPERFDDLRGSWDLTNREVGVGLRLPNGPGGTFVFDGLPEGRWRVMDQESGAESPAALLQPGGPEAQVELRLE